MAEWMVARRIPEGQRLSPLAGTSRRGALYPRVQRLYAQARLAEAYTCTGSCTSKITDLGFSYNARGDLVDVYESTPHSSGYYRVTASYWPNGALNTIQNLNGLPTITYGLDSEGRAKTVSASTGTNPVSNTVYNTASQVTEVDFGSLDKDTAQYDANTGRMTQYKFFVGAQNVTGNLTWNANGTLKTLAITDGLNSLDRQTCNYGYDDLTRIASANCGSVWNQSFAFDPFGNISKSGSSSFQAGYVLADGTTNNRIQSLPGVTPTYDSNGNLTSDGTHTSTWDAEGNPVQLDTTAETYDALGRMVEFGSGNTAVVYSPTGGKLALMSGQSLTKAFVPLPGGATVVYAASGIAYYRHADWLGSSRVASTPSRTKYYDAAYAPYGESYAGSGTTDLSFTGQNQDAVAGFYDFMFRKYNPVHGRWISPDPAGMAAVSLTNPQTWNRYAYVLNNPLALVDSLGLDCVYLNEDGSAVEEVDQSSNSGECATNGGYWVDGGLTGYLIDSEQGTVQLWGATQGCGYGTDCGGLDNQEVTYAQYGSFADSPANHGVTFQLGLALNWNLGPLAGSWFFGMAVDSHGHIAGYAGGGGGTGTGGAASVGVQLAGSNGNSVCALGGPFANVSGTAGYELAGTGDYFQGAGDGPGGIVQGGGVTLGGGGGAGGSFQVTGTKVSPVGHSCVNGKIQCA